MKKILFAATLVALLPLLFSCEKAGNNDNVFKNPTFIHCAGQFIMLDGSPTLSSAASVKAVPQAVAPVYTYVEFTESGIYVVGSLEGSETQYKSGNYTADGTVYTLNGFGTVEVNVTATPAKLTITPTGGASQTMTATYKKAGSTNVAYRGWTIDKTRATVYGFHTPITADFAGCNFNDMAIGLDMPLWLKIVPMVLILFVGHALNFAMAGLSILVHAVRLNTLEFSNHKGVSWAGYAFSPFRKH